MMRCESPKLNESDIPLRGNQPNLSISYLYLHYCSKNFKSCPSSKYFFLFSTLILADLINIKDKCLSQYTHVNVSIHIAHLVRGYLTPVNSIDWYSFHIQLYPINPYNYLSFLSALVKLFLLPQSQTFSRKSIFALL